MTEQVIRGVQTSTKWTQYDTPEASGLLGKKVRSLQRAMLFGAPMSAAWFALVYTAHRVNPNPCEKRKRARALRSKQLRRRTGTGAPG